MYKNGSFNDSSASTQFGGKGKGNPLDHRYDGVEVGEFKKKSTPVNDRLVIGKKSAYIVELSLFENRTQYLGFQATYLIDQTIKKKGNYNVLKR